jgi:ribA/ribD-fused uncharacterized protein
MIKFFNGAYSGFSNFSPHEVKFEGVIYPTSEHAFQAAKTIDPTSRVLIQKLAKASEAKAMGRKLVLRANWDELKLGVMVTILKDKFTRHDALKSLLLSTGENTLVEGNTWHDNYWGACICESCGKKEEQHNWLGTCLMQLRKELR